MSADPLQQRRPRIDTDVDYYRSDPDGQPSDLSFDPLQAQVWTGIGEPDLIRTKGGVWCYFDGVRGRYREIPWWEALAWLERQEYPFPADGRPLRRAS